MNIVLWTKRCLSIAGTKFLPLPSLGTCECLGYLCPLGLAVKKSNVSCTDAERKQMWSSWEIGCDQVNHAVGSPFGKGSGKRLWWLSGNQCWRYSAQDLDRVNLPLSLSSFVGWFISDFMLKVHGISWAFVDNERLLKIQLGSWATGEKQFRCQGWFWESNEGYPYMKNTSQMISNW